MVSNLLQGALKEATAARAAVSLVNCKIVSCHKQLPIGIQDVGKGNRAGFISLLRAVPLTRCKAPISTRISSPLNSDWANWLNESSTSSAARKTEVPVSQDRLGIGARRVFHFGIDSSEVEEPPPQPCDQRWAEILSHEIDFWTNRFVPRNPESESLG